MNTSKKTSLKLEALEQRSMLAGDVAVSVEFGFLKIRGDALGNEIVVTDLGGDKVKIAGEAGTGIKGQTNPYTASGVTRGVLIDLKEGNDKVNFVGNSTHELWYVEIATGPGDDVVAAEKVFARKTELRTSSGKDTVNAVNVNGGELEIETGADDDAVSVDKIFVRKVELETSSGKDTVNVMDVTGSELEIETGADNDVVNIGNTKIRPDAMIKVRELEIETGSGVDQIVVQDAVIQALYTEIETGADDDVVSVRDVQAQGLFKVESQSGKDAVKIDGSTFVALWVYLGGGDADELSILNTKSTRTRLSGGPGLKDALTIKESNLGVLKTEGFEIT